MSKNQNYNKGVRLEREVVKIFKGVKPDDNPSDNQSDEQLNS